MIEAVPGACALLVDGSVDPDRWTLTRSSGELIEWRPGRRGSEHNTPLLDAGDLAHLLSVLSRIETLFAWPPDVEWTGRAPDTVVLQARPITSTPPDAEDERGWYLTLRPTLRRLSALAARVTDELIPALESEGVRFAAQDLALCTDAELAAALLERSDSLRRWKNTYWDEFIPLAHGVRQLARYYTDSVRPDDPYEFVGLLKSVDMLATRRNQVMADLAATLREDSRLRLAVSDARAAMAGADARTWRQSLEPVPRASRRSRVPGRVRFTGYPVHGRHVRHRAAARSPRSAVAHAARTGGRRAPRCSFCGTPSGLRSCRPGGALVQRRRPGPPRRGGRGAADRQGQLAAARR